MFKKISLSILVPVFTGCATLPPPPVEDFDNCVKFNTTTADAKAFSDRCMGAKLAAMLTVRNRNPETGQLAYNNARFAEKFLESVSSAVENSKKGSSEHTEALAKKDLFLKIMNLNGISEDDIKKASRPENFTLPCQQNQNSILICK